MTTPQGEGVKPFVYGIEFSGREDRVGTHVHYLDMPPCEICDQENDIFDNLLKDLGAYTLEAKMSKMASYKRYYRAKPFDGRKGIVDLDEWDDIVPGNPLDEIIADETVAEFKATLTPRVVEVVELLEEGYKPREIAAKQGKKQSNAIRWHKHIVKKKLEERRG